MRLHSLVLEYWSGLDRQGYLLDSCFFTMDWISFPPLDSTVKQLQGIARDVNKKLEFEHAVTYDKAFSETCNEVLIPENIVKVEHYNKNESLLKFLQTFLRCALFSITSAHVFKIWLTGLILCRKWRLFRSWSSELCPPLWEQLSPMLQVIVSVQTMLKTLKSFSTTGCELVYFACNFFFMQCHHVCLLLAQPLFWVYDQDKILKCLEGGKNAEFYDPTQNPFFILPTGAQTLYGDCALAGIRGLLQGKGVC